MQPARLAFTVFWRRTTSKLWMHKLHRLCKVLDSGKGLPASPFSVLGTTKSRKEQGLVSIVSAQAIERVGLKENDAQYSAGRLVSRRIGMMHQHSCSQSSWRSFSPILEHLWQNCVSIIMRVDLLFNGHYCGLQLRSIGCWTFWSPLISTIVRA